MVRIRLKRFGRTHSPAYRLCAMDARTPRNGRPIEELGFYHPCNKDESKQVKLNAERIAYWLSVGAQPLSLIHISEPTRQYCQSRMPASA